MMIRIKDPVRLEHIRRARGDKSPTETVNALIETCGVPIVTAAMVPGMSDAAALAMVRKAIEGREPCNLNEIRLTAGELGETKIPRIATRMFAMADEIEALRATVAVLREAP